MGDDNQKSKLSFWVKITASIFGLLVLAGSTFFSVDARYAKADVVKEQKTTLSKEIVLVADNLLKTIQRDREHADIRFYQNQIDLSHDKITEILQDLRQQPNNNILHKRLEDEKIKQQRYKEKLDKVLSN